MNSDGGGGGGSGSAAGAGVTFTQIRGLAHKLGNDKNTDKASGARPFIKHESPDQGGWGDVRGQT